MGVMESPLDRGRLVVTPHAITLEGQRNLESDLRHGETLYAFLARHVDLAEQWEVAVDGGVVPVERWTQVYPNHGQVIECRSAVGKSVLRIVALLALTYFTLGAGGIAGGAFLGYTGAAGWIAAGAAYVGGSILINKVLAPKPANFSLDSKTQDPTFNLSGTRNTFRPYEPAALLFGKVKITPDLATDQPYAFFRGSDQYLATTLCCGINVDRVDDLYNGEALLSTFDGVTVYHTGFSGMTDDGLPLYSNTDTVAGGSLDSPVGTYVQRTTVDGSVRIELDFEYAIYNYDSKGKPKYNTEGITIQYREVGASTWAVTYPTSLTGSTPKTQRFSIGFNVAEGQYEVQVKRNGTSSTDSTAHCEINWTSLRAIQNDTGNYKGLSRIGVLCKATGQLNGALDELRCVAYSKDLEYWNGSAWVTDSTRISNPGAQYLKFLRGHYDEDGVLIGGYGLPDSMIDLEAIKGFILHCDANGYTYDYYLKDARARSEVLDAIAMAGFGQRVQAGGKYSVAWSADEQPLSGVVNMATIKRGQFQVDYTLAGAADGIEATYLDASDWTNKVIRVSAPGVTTPLNPARIALEGVTDEARAAEMARYHLGQSLYQYKSIQYGTDLEHLSYGRLSVLALQHDLTQWGYGGRVQGVDVAGDGTVTVLLDEPAPAPATGNAYIGLRIPGEDVYRVFQIVPFEGESTTVELVEMWPVDVPDVPGDSADNPASDTIWIYDFKSQPGYRVRVVQVEPEAGLKGATVTCVPESDEFWTYVKTGDYTPPAASTLPSVRPVASNVQVAEEVVAQGNTQFTQLHVTFDVAGAMDHALIFAQYTSLSAETTGEVVQVASTFTRDATFRISAAGTYTIIVRPYSVDGIVGGTVQADYDTIATSIEPLPFDVLTVTEVAGGLRRYAWSYNTGTIPPPDLAGAEIRYIAQPEPAVWEDMTPLGGDGFHASTFESTLPEAGDWTFAVRSRNTSGVLANTLLTLDKTLGDNLGEVVSGIEDAGALQDAAIDAAQAAADAAQTAADAAQAQVDVVAAQVGDIMAADAWSSGTAYASGELVQDGGTPAKLYRAKQAVPAGTLLTNTAYWELIGNYASLGEAVAATATLATATADDLTALASDVSVIQARMPSGTDTLANEARVVTAETAAASAAAANASAITAANAAIADKADSSVVSALSSTVSSQGDAIDANTSAISAANSAISGKADSSALSALESTVSSQGDTISANSSAITTVQAGLVTAQDTADDAAAAAAAAQSDADSANSAIADIANDGILSRSEKPAVYLQVVTINNELAGIQASADSFSVSRTAHDAAHTALTSSYLYTLSPAWDDVSQDTPITRSTFQTKFSDYYTARTALLNAIAAAAKALADAAQDTANDAVTATTALTARVDVNEDGIASYLASWTVLLNVNGKISGVTAVNDGETSLFEVAADKFNVVGSGNALTWDSADATLSAVNGSNAAKMGAGFGSDSDKLVFYFGADGSNSSRTFAGSSVAITAAGKAKLAGTGTNYASGWSGAAITSSYSSASPAVVTINVASGTFYSLGTPYSYSASSNTTSQTRGTTVRYYLYYSDSALSAGSKTLNISTDISVSYADPNKVFLGFVDVTVPASGSGSGGGGTPPCVSVDAWVIRNGKRARAGDVVVGDVLALFDPVSGASEGVVTYSVPALTDMVRIVTEGGHTLACSTAAPIPVERGGFVLAPDLTGHRILVAVDDRTRWETVADIVRLPRGWVQHITVGDRCFWAGDADAYLLHHNVKAGP